MTKIDDETIRFVLGRMEDWMGHSRDGKVLVDGVRGALGRILLEANEDEHAFVIRVRARDRQSALAKLDYLAPELDVRVETEE